MDFDGMEYNRKRNEEAGQAYCAFLDSVAAVREKRTGDSEYDRYFRRLSQWILELADLEERLSDNYFNETPFDRLLEENERLYLDIEPELYGSSYADPAYSVGIFGDGYGQLLSSFFVRFRHFISYAFKHKRYRMSEECQLFLEVEALFGKDIPPYDLLRETAARIDRADSTDRHRDLFTEMLDPDFTFYRHIASVSDLSDLRYLFRYGCRVSENVLRTAGFIAESGSGLADQLARSVVDAYIRGLEDEGKKIESRRMVSVMAPVGYEPVINRISKVLESIGMIPHVRCPVYRPVNRQYSTDHKFDYVLHFNEETAKIHAANREEVLKGLSYHCDRLSGRIIFFEFGEDPFSPERKPECLKPDAEIAALWRKYQSDSARIIFSYLPRSETSFSAIAFPSPDIRGDFQAIFQDTLEINTLDSVRYQRIQQEMIDTLDRADHVRIKGLNGNRTDLRVALQALDDPSKQTNFLNCIDTVNIPLGEVFTSPGLKGTDGVLHVEEAFLDGMRYDNLTLTFSDGYVVDYDCSNFDSREENRKYIHENLFYPHDTLPMGEFAIGSNTHAYAMAKRHGIMDLLPVLIIEKMGPHFAIGDTCFSNEEDHVVYNRLDGKEIVARENELSMLRKEDPDKAYTHKHMDITLPYSSLDSISAVLPDGEELYIIRNSRFVLGGTEALNEPIDSVDGNRT